MNLREMKVRATISAALICVLGLLFAFLSDRSPDMTHVGDLPDDSTPKIVVEQQMRADEIAGFYAEHGGVYKNLEECFDEEGKWWKEVSWSCPPIDVSRPRTWDCEELDESRPFRVKFCEGSSWTIVYHGGEK